MALQFVFGRSGSGKTQTVFEQIVKEAAANREKNYLILVPEQFTMATQRTLVDLAPNKAIMNIDVLSFKRLAYRVFDDLGIQNLAVLEETGKNLILRKIAGEKKEELGVLRPNMNRMGYIEELKSLLSELMQYGVGPDQLDQLIHGGQLSESFSAKLKDISLMYRSFTDYLSGTYITAEEILQLLIDRVEESVLLKDSVLVFDEFTGFTPIQNQLLKKLLPLTERIQVILTFDERMKSSLTTQPQEQELFYLTKKTVQSLRRMAVDCGVEELPELWLLDSKTKRFAQSPELAHLEANLFRNTYTRYKQVPDNLTLSCYRNPREELLGVAREITRLVRQDGYRYRDIAVVTGAVETYGNYVPEIFDKYHLPYFLDQTSELVFHPLIECIRSLLNIIVMDFSYESMLRFLRCGYTDLSREEIDRLENYLLATGIRGAGLYSKRWVRTGRKKDAFDLELMNGIREKLYGLLAPLKDSFDQGKEVHTCIVTLYQALAQMQAQEKTWARADAFKEEGQQAKATMEEKLYLYVLQLMEKFDTLLGKEVMEVEEFAEILDAGLSGANLAIIPQGLDTLTIGDIERTRLDQVKVIFFVGVNDGVIPKAAGSGGIISEYEREILQGKEIELAPGSREQAFIQRFYLYRNLTKPSTKLYISYSKVDAEGATLRSSYLIPTLLRMFPEGQVREVDDLSGQANFATREAAMDYLISGAHDEKWYALVHLLLEEAREKEDAEDYERISALLAAPYTTYVPEQISHVVARRLYGSDLLASVTRLEKYADCPYAHFLSYGLELQERELHQLIYIDLGNIYHNALERYSAKVADSSYGWSTIPEDIRKQYVQEAMADTLLSYDQMTLFETGANVHLAERMRETFAQTVEILTYQLKQGIMEPVGIEMKFTGEKGAQEVSAMTFQIDKETSMRLTGRIDRLDTAKEDGRLYVKVLDYKTGDKKLNLQDIYEGRSLQLMVYLDAAMEVLQDKNPSLSVEPAGVLYQHIDNPTLEELPENDPDALFEALLKALKPKGRVNEDQDIYRAMDQDFEKASLVIPVKLKKDGDLDSNSTVLTSDQFATVREYTHNLMQQEGEEIFDGHVEIRPRKNSSQNSSCTYCPYHSVCGFDYGIEGYEMRSTKQKKDSQVLESMETENKVKAGRHKEGEMQ